MNGLYFPRPPDPDDFGIEFDDISARYDGGDRGGAEDSAHTLRLFDLLGSLTGLASELVEAEAQSLPEPSEEWVRTVIAQVSAAGGPMDETSGRPTLPPPAGMMPKATVHEVIASAEQAVPGTLIGSVRVTGTPEQDPEIDISAEVSVVDGDDVDALVAELARQIRTKVGERFSASVRDLRMNVQRFDLDSRSDHGELSW